MKETGCFVGFLIFALLATGEAIETTRHDQSVLAWVGDRKITVSDFEDRFYRLTPVHQRMYRSPKKRGRLLFHMISDKLMPMLSHTMGLEKDLQIRRQLDEMEDRYSAEVSAQKQEDLLTKALWDHLHATELIVPDSAMRRFYNFRKDLYDKAFVIDASRIDLPTQAEADLALDRLGKGLPFDKVAKQMSRDRSTAEDGGRMSPLIVGRKKQSTLEKTLLMMQPGQVSGAIEDSGGFVILKLHSMKPVTFEAVQPTIQKMLEQDRLSDWIMRHWNDFKIRVDEKLLANLDLRAPN